MRELKLTYLNKVQDETNTFLQSRIKHHYMQPDRELSLDLTVQEAEILIAANQEVQDLAEKGGLKDLHIRFNELHGKVETDYFALRDYLAQTIQVIEGKENQLYDTLIHEYGLPLNKHGDGAPMLDVLGLCQADVAFDNMAMIEGHLEKGHEQAHKISEIRGWLHSYMGIKARIYSIETDLKEAYTNHVAKSNDETSLTSYEFRQLAAARDNYQTSFARWAVDEWAKNEYDTFIGTLNEVFETKGKKLISDFQKFEEVYNERQRLYNGFKKSDDPD